MAGGGQEAAADQPRPKRVGRCPGPVEIEDLQFSRGACGVEHMRQTAGDLSRQDNEADAGAQHIHDHLDHVGPDDGRHAAFESVKKCQENDQKYRCHAAGMQNDGDHDRDGEYPHSFGERPGDQEDSRRDLPDVRAETALHEGVGGEKLSLEVLRKKNCRDHDAGQQVAEDYLEEHEASAVGERRRADDGQRAGFRRYNGERDSPPRGGPAAEEVIFQRFLRLAEARAEPGDRGEIGEDDSEINGSQAEFP